ncbi:MAG TPA: hypothetical protein VGN42_13640 [Pirellulales bacterium]|nr:hypothetical protein [Pirellulales bacterium]
MGLADVGAQRLDIGAGSTAAGPAASAAKPASAGPASSSAAPSAKALRKDIPGAQADRQARKQHAENILGHGFASLGCKQLEFSKSEDGINYQLTKIIVVLHHFRAILLPPRTRRLSFWPQWRAGGKDCSD